MDQVANEITGKDKKGVEHTANSWQDVMAFKRRGWIAQQDIDDAVQRRLNINLADWKRLANDIGSLVADGRNIPCRNAAYEEAKAAVVDSVPSDEVLGWMVTLEKGWAVWAR